MLTLKAYAKVNLALDVLHKRPDGYHEVAMIMQSISLADTLYLQALPYGITLQTKGACLPCDASNLAYRAAQLVMDTMKMKQGIHIVLDKNIPVAAGLAGGSADAAAVLRGLNRLYDLRLTWPELEQLAAQLGSDVPFCLRGGTVLATGRGEKLNRLPDLPSCYFVLAKPAVDVSTAWVYSHYRPAASVSHPDIAEMQQYLIKSDLGSIAAGVANVLETVTIPAYPEIQQLKDLMLHHGALASLMSGSGPTVFGLCGSLKQAESVAAGLRNETGARIMVAYNVTEVEDENGTAVIAH